MIGKLNRELTIEFVGVAALIGLLFVLSLCCSRQFSREYFQ